MVNYQEMPTRLPRMKKDTKELWDHISNWHHTLAFSRKWLHEGGETAHLRALNDLCRADLVNKYPPLVENAGVGSYVAQYEHTLICKPRSKEILSRGLDY